MRRITTVTGRAFTLVELLVVIGIIAVLVAILLPVLSRSREAANRIKCMGTLRAMAQAAHLHAADHHGYMPAAGDQSPMHLGVRATPEGLRDTARRKYIYYQDGSDVTRPVPLPAALGYYMGLRPALDPLFSSGLEQKLASEPVRRHFTCASQDPDTMRKGYVLSDGTTRIQPTVRISYIFNNSALGRQVHVWGETPAGNLSRIRRPDVVFLFADGNTAPNDSFFGYSISAQYSTRDVLYWNFLAIRSQFDPERHRGKMNVVFVDGHAETVQMPDGTADEPRSHGDFQRIGVTLGIYD